MEAHQHHCHGMSARTHTHTNRTHAILPIKFPWTDGPWGGSAGPARPPPPPAPCRCSSSPSAPLLLSVERGEWVKLTLDSSVNDLCLSRNPMQAMRMRADRVASSRSTAPGGCRQTPLAIPTKTLTSFYVPKCTAHFPVSQASSTDGVALGLVACGGDDGAAFLRVLLPPLHVEGVRVACALVDRPRPSRLPRNYPSRSSMAM